MAYDYNSRIAFEKRHLKVWEKTNARKIEKLPQEQKKFLEELTFYSSYTTYYRDVKIQHYQKEHVKEVDATGLTLCDVMNQNFKELMDLYIPDSMRQDYEYMLNQQQYFQYSEALYRPTVRTRKNSAHFREAFRMMQGFKIFGMYNVSVLDYLTGKIDAELLDFNQNSTYGREMHLICFDDILAARIDAKEQDIIDALMDAFLSENNTVIINTDMIRGILKSKNTDLHQMLGKFLLAAKLQEGVRQAICENMDCGRIEAFLTLLQVIEQENLLRFSSVKRAIATWTGICSYETMERESKKLFPLICEAVRNQEKALAMTQTEDSVQIITGLWGLGFYEVEDATNRICDMIQSGSYHQQMTASYYLDSIYNDSLSQKIAKGIVEKYQDDFKMVAAYIKYYLPSPEILAASVAEVYRKKEATTVHKPISLSEYYEDETEARNHYHMMKNMLSHMKKKKLEYIPAIFPWYGVVLEKSDIIQRMAITAYMLQDNTLIDEICPYITDIKASDSYRYIRRDFVQMLLHIPKTEMQWETLIKEVGDKEEATRVTAHSILTFLSLQEKDYLELEKLLRLKNADTRQYVIDLLFRQEEKDVEQSIFRLLSSPKDAFRLAGLDMLKTLCEKDTKQSSHYIDILCKSIPDREELTSQERILYDAIQEKQDTHLDIVNIPGYGIYNPSASYQPILPAADYRILSRYFKMSKRTLDQYFKKIFAFIEKHGSLEYTGADGTKRLLVNGLHCTVYGGNEKSIEEMYPFPELWEELYDTIIKDEKTFFNLYVAATSGESRDSLVNYDLYIKAEHRIFGDADASYCIPFVPPAWKHQLLIVFRIIESMKHLTFPRELSLAAILYAIQLPEQVKWLETNPSPYRTYLNGKKEYMPFTRTSVYHLMIQNIQNFQTAEEFRESFPILYSLDQAYHYNEFKDNMSYYSYSGHNVNQLSVFAYINAVELNIITREFAYKAIFEVLGLTYCVEALGSLLKNRIPWYREQLDFKRYFPEEYQKREMNTESTFYQRCVEFYEALVNLILNVELKRGDTATIFTSSVKAISRITGISRLMEILNALGDSTLERSSSYSSYREIGKKESLSYLLSICYPGKDETAADLTKAVKEHHISRKRLIEISMYAPQWLDLVEAVLKIPGLKSGCYYFMAHLNEYSITPEKESTIAKYTPLSKEELRNGCFDVVWFQEVYQTLGEKTFALLYQAAKYVSDGNKHTRARKYADAALGKVDRDALEKIIEEKRNKDLLMSYGLIPMKDRSDALHRYEFLQKFLKESKKFGAQRRASEALCVEVALKNMAWSYGYVDELRLTLAMETELVTSKSGYFDGVDIGAYHAQIIVDIQGNAKLEIEKAGKKLKTIPTALKKAETFVEIKEFYSKLKEQYRRCVSMFERSMEEEEVYSLGELRNLCQNPVIAGILNHLVYMIKASSQVGTLQELALCDDGTEVCVAHPLQLYRQNELPKYQRYFFEKNQESGVKQPFKQVFREFYVKLAEEKDAMDSRMFAGYQIQPKKTLAVLKTRRWVADYEEGLQRSFYKENIIATIYALADWFSPSEVEAPTLEYVSFYDRKTFKQLKLTEVPDVLYSEVMRDVDLAVSTAHVGGVDPETSHSTIEMRKVIFAFNVELFGLKNVTLEGTHAYVDGSYGRYSIQLGSGVIHKIGGSMINILPVHSQQRGKIFLPFIDDDPKTAEIMSKILLLANDNKVKDPYILEQLVR